MKTGFAIALAACCVLPGQAETKNAPTWRARYADAVKLVRAKKGAEALPLMEKLRAEAIAATNKPDAAAAAGQLMWLYTGEKREAFANEMKDSPDSTKELKLTAISALCDNIMAYWGTTWVPDYLNYYLYGISDEERDRNRAKNIRLLGEAVEIAPEDVSWRMRFAHALLYLKEWDKAEAQYRIVAENTKAKNDERHAGYFGVAECRFAKGDRAGALATLDTLKGLKLKLANDRWGGTTAMLNWTIKFLKGEYLEDLGLPMSNEAKPFPAPRQATYSEEFTPLAEVTVDLDGLEEDDARVRLLKSRLDRMGVKMAFKGFKDWFLPTAFLLKITWDPKAELEGDTSGALAQPEGYVLDIGAKGATITARTARGATWGVVSFLQAIDYAGKRVRRMTVRDWPECENRGILGRWYWQTTEFALFNKMNSMCHMRNPAGWHNYTPLHDWVVLEMGRQLKEFGLDLMIGIQWVTMYPQLPIARQRTLDYRIEVCRHYAENGINVYFPFDDERYLNIPKEDTEKWGTNFRFCDADHVNAIYRAVKKDYPDFRLIFCPPFYWGPDSGHPYPENREAYLETLKKLDPGIGLYWTGPQVKGITKSKYQTDWYAGLTGRRPWIFQNGTGPHNLLHYTIDPIDWVGWHYKGFFKEVEGFQRNTDGSCGGDAMDASLAGALWNPDRFDPEENVRRAVNQLCGDGACETLKPGLASLAYFDKYKHGALSPDIVNEDPKDLFAKYSCASDCWAKAVAKCPRLKAHAEFARGVGFAKRVVDGAKNPPDFVKRHHADVTNTAATAARETGYDKAKGDILVTALDMNGCKLYNERGNPNTGAVKVNRFCKLMRGSRTANHALSFRFECDPFPPTGAYEMLISARDDELKAENTIRISANGKKVYEGALGFPSNDYEVRKVTLPPEALIRHNTITVENLTDGFNDMGTPWFSLNYIVLRKTAGSKK